MKKFVFIAVGIIGLLLLVGAWWIYQIILLATDHPTSDRLYLSPDTQHVLVAHVITDKTVKNYTHVIFEVRDRAGKSIFTVDTRASNVMTWSARWVGNRRIMLDSSDIGYRAWEMGEDGTWREVPSAQIN